MGSIYQIECLKTGLVYIGQTTRTLKKRLIEHKSNFKTKPEKNCSSFLVLEHGNYEIYELERVEDKDMLNEREYYYIQNNECVNTYDGTFDMKEYREANREAILEKHKEYREANREAILEKQKEYYEANREKHKEYYEANREKMREYWKANREAILEKRKEYYEANREAILEKHKEKYTCECSKTLTKNHKVRHERTNVHKNWLANNP